MKKNELLKLAERCEAGAMWEDAINEAFKLLGFTTSLVFTIGPDWVLHFELDAVAALEKELLPDGCRIDVRSFISDPVWQVCIERKVEAHNWIILLGQATAPTEPLARLAALLKALSEEME